MSQAPELQPELRGFICGLWVGEGGRVHLSVATPEGGRRETEAVYHPFAWIRPPAVPVQIEGLHLEDLKGEGVFSQIAHAREAAPLEQLEEAVGKGAYDEIRPRESQFLLQHRARLFADLRFNQLRRCQLDIETSSPDGGFSDASRPDDRVLAIGLRLNGENRLLVLETHDDEGERRLLELFTRTFLELDPDIVEGHNLFRFDLDFLRQRCKRLKLPCAWGRFGQKAVFRNTRLKVAERWVDFPRCDLAGRAVVDTYLMVLLHDITARELQAYGLKDVAIHMGVTPEDSEERTYLPGAEIQKAWREDRARFLAYLGDDLRETEGIANILLPTYFEQTRSFPILLQEATLRGTTAKIDLLFLEEYYHARHACPVPPEVRPFEGGYTRSFQEGVHHKVLHFDIVSLYPSLLLHIGRNPVNDRLGIFIPLLRSLREYRLRYKQLARSSPDAEERAEAQARQASFKILINSFYGYLGFSGARFGDGELAAEVTRRGRELLQALIDEFQRQGCLLLEADTDGIYLASERYFNEPEALLALVAHVLPEGIDLDYDGRYPVMFCYKAKNYALYDGKKMILRGSALRSRGMEPYLKRLTDAAIRHLLEIPGAESPAALIKQYREGILAQRTPVGELAKSEALVSSPESYEAFIAGGGKPRRASAEVSLLMNPRPKAGDRVAYFITAKAKGRTSDWQRARPVAQFNPATAPYDPGYYTEKLDDWIERYGVFLGLKPQADQGELLLG
jgi:DNA polymerase elongation subunit (family B)